MTFLGVTCPYYGGKQVGNPANVIKTSGVPSSAITAPNGTLAVDNAAAIMYAAVSQVGGVVTWSILGGATGAVATLTGDTGTATPAAGNIKIAGTANQITTAASGSTVTLSVPSAFTAPGSITGTLGAITATNGNIVMGTIGNKIIVPTGSNASAGTSGAMSGSPGSVTVATTASSTTALIFYSRKTTGGTPGQVSISAQDGTGFTLLSTGNETSTFNWWIINA